MDGTVDFYRNWANYKLGFGEARSEHWLGNDNIHILTHIHDSNELRIDMESAANEKAYTPHTLSMRALALIQKKTTTGFMWENTTPHLQQVNDVINLSENFYHCRSCELYCTSLLISGVWPTQF